MRVTRDEPWAPWMIGNPVYNLLLGTLFQWGVALHHVESAKIRKKEKTWAEARKDLRIMGKKMGKQAGKDYIVYPALAGTNWKHTLKANAIANLIRNYWAYMVIFCGHFPDGAEKFTRESFEEETRGEWYLRQMLGSANFNAGPIMAFMSGNLCYQIEHHLFPDLPSNRYAEIGVRVRAVCEKYDLPYTTGPLLRQYWQSFWTILKLAVPNNWLRGTPDDAPETHSEKKFPERRATGNPRPALRIAQRAERPQRRGGLAPPQSGELPRTEHQHDRCCVGQCPVAGGAQSQPVEPCRRRGERCQQEIGHHETGHQPTRHPAHAVEAKQQERPENGEGQPDVEQDTARRLPPVSQWSAQRGDDRTRCGPEDEVG